MERLLFLGAMSTEATTPFSGLWETNIGSVGHRSA